MLRLQAALALLLVALAVPISRAAERPWIEVRSDNFQVVSDAGEKTAREVAFRFEQIRAAFAVLNGQLRVDPGRPLTILAARDEKSLATLIPAYFEEKGRARPAGLFLPIGHRVFVVLRADAEGDADDQHSVAFHEYVHLLESLNFRTLPVWLSEGLAEFYAFTGVQKDRVLLGRAPFWHVAVLQELRPIPFAEFLDATRASEHYNEERRAGIFYAQAWAFTHWLLVGDKGANRARLRDFLGRLDSGEDLRAASAALGSPRVLDAEIARYVRNPAFYMQAIAPIALEKASAPVRPVPSAELEAWRALLHVGFDRKDDARRAIEASLKASPSEPLAHEAATYLAFSEGRLADARSAAEAALRAAPESVPALMLKGALALQVGGAGAGAAVQAFEAATRFAPAYGAAWTALATTKVAAGGSTEEQLQLVRRAVEAEPANVLHRIALAGALHDHGEAKAALDEAERALALATTDEEKAAGRVLMEAIRTAKAPSDPAAGRRHHEQSCLSGKAESCEDLARALLRGEGGPRDEAQARAMRERACEIGRMPACVDAASMFERGQGGAADPERASALYEKACDAEYRPGCYNLARSYEHGKGRAVDLDKARAVYAANCAKGHGDSCTQEGDLYWFGKGVQKDEARAGDIWEKACEAGTLRSCRALAWSLDKGRGRPADVPRALSLYERACDGGVAIACADLAEHLMQGKHIARDPKRGVTLLDKACSKGTLAACVTLGRALLSGSGVPVHAEKALSSFEKACAGEELRGCGDLADLLNGGGFGITRDVQRAESLASRACDKGSAWACSVLGAIVMDRDPSRAAGVLEKGCEAGVPRGCRELALLHIGGRGVTRDLARAKQLLEKACAGWATACYDLAGLLQYDGSGEASRAPALRKKACDAGYRPACTP